MGSIPNFVDLMGMMDDATFVILKLLFISNEDF